LCRGRSRSADPGRDRDGLARRRRTRAWLAAVLDSAEGVRRERARPRVGMAAPGRNAGRRPRKAFAGRMEAAARNACRARGTYARERTSREMTHSGTSVGMLTSSRNNALFPERFVMQRIAREEAGRQKT